MNRVIIILFCSLAVALAARRQKRDAAAELAEALNLFYYPNTYTIPSITLDTKAPSVGCGYASYNGFQLADIIGQAKATDMESCVKACLNNKDCFGLNFVQSTSQCVLLKSCTTNPQDAWRSATVKTSHVFFQDCPSKPNKTPNKPPGGSAPSGCGLPFFQPKVPDYGKTRIVGGSDAVPFSFPWIGRIFYDNQDGTGSRCGSSLVPGSSSTESDTVITAAHCVLDKKTGQPLNPKQFTVYFGDYTTAMADQQEIKASVKAIIYNKNYTNNKNDIAVMRLTAPVKYNNFIRPVCLPALNQAPKDPKSCVLAGWGRINDATQDVAVKLQQAKLPILDDATCSKAWGSTYDKTNMVCAGGLDGKAASCQGDSGGPLVCFEDGHYTLYGATSFGGESCLSLPAVYARISGLRNFIDQATTQLHA